MSQRSDQRSDLFGSMPLKINEIKGATLGTPSQAQASTAGVELNEAIAEALELSVDHRRVIKHSGRLSFKRVC
tara:strand:+ start:163 stop:381 length:219 start_codon:yes stop_codon:yes gene_type:complete